MIELTKRLTEAFGVSGYEEGIRAAISDEIAPYVDDVRVDVMGNLIAHRKGTGGGKRIMLAAHMDQIGLMVTHIEERGFLRFASVGFIYPLASWGGQVRFADGTVGTVGVDGRVNTRTTLPELRDMFIDVGALDRSEVKQRVGDVAVFWPAFVAQGDTWFSPNLDDRVGCVALAQTLKELHGTEIPHDVYAVFTTQEEVGVRGATTAAYEIEPEVALALDVTLTGDLPHTSTAMDVSIGKGVAIKVKDAGMIGHAGLNRLLVGAAEANGIPYQLEVLQGGSTDAMAIQVSRSGVPASALSIPSRYVHTPSQLVNQRDVAATVQLLKALLGEPITL